MSDTAREAELDRAREAFGRGDLEAAFDLLTALDTEAGLDPSDLAMLADASYATGHLEGTIACWERAHAGHVAAGSVVDAAGAAVKVALHLLMDTGLMAPVRGWTRRAERLLEGVDATSAHAWLAVVRTYERFLSGDFVGAQAFAARAIGIGDELGLETVVIAGRVASARCAIFLGEVEEGLELLEAAAVDAVAAELDPISLGIIYCEVLCAYQTLAQYDLAEEWTVAMEGWQRVHAVGSFGGRCRVHRAEMLRVRGSSAEAELEAQRACEELRPFMRLEFGWPLTELGTIRLRNGDLAGAEEAFLEAHEMGWDPQPGLALLRLAQGDIAAASSSIRHAIEHPVKIPSKEMPPNNDLRRAPLLEAQVEIAVAAGDVDRARWAADQLRHVVTAYDSKGLRAGAATANGRALSAEGKFEDAVGVLDEAVRLWIEVGAPYETAVARLALGIAHRACGNDERALLEFGAARSTFERIGAETLAERASAEAQREGVTHLPGATDGTDPKANRFQREGEYWTITFDGKDVRVRDLVGLRYLGRLFAEPGREFHVLDLVASQDANTNAHRESGSSGSSGDAGALLDAHAKESYRRRLLDIDEDVEEARGFGDLARAERAEAEREFIVRELSRAVGLTGRDRRAGDATERARASVTRAIRNAISRISDNHAALGAHLDSTVKTGTYCIYAPDPRVPVAWQL